MPSGKRDKGKDNVVPLRKRGVLRPSDTPMAGFEVDMDAGVLIIRNEDGTIDRVPLGEVDENGE